MFIRDRYLNSAVPWLPLCLPPAKIETIHDWLGLAWNFHELLLTMPGVIRPRLRMPLPRSEGEARGETSVGVVFSALRWLSLSLMCVVRDSRPEAFPAPDGVAVQDRRINFLTDRLTYCSLESLDCASVIERYDSPHTLFILESDSGFCSLPREERRLVAFRLNRARGRWLVLSDGADEGLYEGRKFYFRAGQIKGAFASFDPGAEPCQGSLAAKARAAMENLGATLAPGPAPTAGAARGAACA